jgi:hypothetical protein
MLMIPWSHSCTRTVGAREFESGIGGGREEKSRCCDCFVVFIVE